MIASDVTLEIDGQQRFEERRHPKRRPGGYRKQELKMFLLRKAQQPRRKYSKRLFLSFGVTAFLAVNVTRQFSEIYRSRFDRFGTYLLFAVVVGMAIENVWDFYKLFSTLQNELRANPGQPKLAAFILLLVPSADREHLRGDLDEEFEIKQRQQGRRAARKYYWEQVIGSVAPLLLEWIKDLAEFALLWRGIKR